MKTVVMLLFLFSLLFIFALSLATATTVRIGDIYSEDKITVPLMINDVEDVAAATIKVSYEPSVIVITDVGNSDFERFTPNLWYAEQGWVKMSGYNMEAGMSGAVKFAELMITPRGSYGVSSDLIIDVETLSDSNYTPIYAEVINGTFTVSKLGTIAGRITYACNGTEIAGVVVNLTEGGTVVNTTVTNETGYYIFTDVSPNSYFVNASKPRFFDNSTEVTVIAGETVAMMLWLKGDLNNDGIIADVGDVVLVLRASVGDIPGDERYDLNGNGVIADAGDVVLLLRASIGDIILL